MENVRRTRGVRAPQSVEDRIRGTLQHAINNPVTKNPTRFVPDLPGAFFVATNSVTSVGKCPVIFQESTLRMGNGGLSVVLDPCLESFSLPSEIPFSIYFNR